MNDFKGLVASLLEIVNYAVPLVFALILAIVIWKVVDAWMIGGGDPQKIEAGKKVVLFSVLVMVVVISIWGIVGVLQDSLLR